MNHNIVMADNANTCTCGERPEIELNTDARPLVVLSDEECGCCCDEVELYTDHQPDILLFEEWADEHVDDIVAAREAAEAARDAVLEKSAVIEGKVNLLLDDTTTIKRELRNGISDIRGDISSGVSAIRQDIANIKIEINLEECSEEEIYEMFPNEESETE